ncbi:hypothetical protein [Salipiger bermudensis]|uniref:hypothetical protein n=1 Tax=Salipiger bermudensis TaxID=344736 RepID=UPI001A8F7CB3|nr:hypothetical protein [Salipiger bermudensis]MBN9674662.1 hypothetical protein [Salipiger bermudensis]
MIWLISSVFFALGAMLPVASFTDGVASVLVTFFGLMATAILAALSLLVGNVLSSAWTVSKLRELKSELDSLITKMTRTLAVLVIGALCVIVYQLGLPKIDFNIFPAWLPVASLPSWSAELPQRLVQGLVSLCLGLCADHIVVVSRAFKKVLDARYELALADSVRRTERAAPKSEDIATGFATPKDFGARIPRGN